MWNRPPAGTNSGAYVTRWGGREHEGLPRCDDRPASRFRPATRLQSHSDLSTIGRPKTASAPPEHPLTKPHRPVRETKVTVKIPRPLYRKIQLVVDGSGFNSPTDFIVFVLRDLMGEAEDSKREYSPDELDALKRKLKKLGYL